MHNIDSIHKSHEISEKLYIIAQLEFEDNFNKEIYQKYPEFTNYIRSLNKDGIMKIYTDLVNEKISLFD
jgi:hypothetical protein